MHNFELCFPSAVFRRTTMSLLALLLLDHNTKYVLLNCNYPLSDTVKQAALR